VANGFYRNPNSLAVQNAKSVPALKAIARTPEATWFTSSNSVKTVRASVSALTTKAAKSKKTPIITLYAIPGRDCGGESAGGLTAKKYTKWIANVAAGLAKPKAVVILEPDALAQLGTCAGQGDRTGLLRSAVTTLTAAGAWVYLDAGHSNWVDATTMAARLTAAGVADARGFATNVSNFNATADETAYAKSVQAALTLDGVTGTHFVIDTSRNGNGATDDAQWCNPPGRALGTRSTWVRRGGLDAYLWIKAPGESDGECNGGPASGQWWTEGALALISG
jgi:endoglucanase